MVTITVGAGVLAMVLAGPRSAAQGGDANAEPEKQAQDGSSHPVFPAPPKVSKLENGLRVVTVPWDSPGIVSYYTLVRVGSRDEVKSGHSGFAHLFEHMMFRGTEKYPEDVYERKIQSFGADNNAYTTQDFTMYTVTLPEDALGQLVKLEADRFQNLSYDEQQFKTETGAVLGEYHKSASNPFLKMWEALSEMAFERHTYGHTTLGYLEDIKRMPEEYRYSKQFFQRFYTPDNTTLIVSGDVEHGSVMKLVRKHYGSWRGERAYSRVPREPGPEGGDRRHIEWDGEVSPRMFIGYRTPSFAGGKLHGERRAEAIERTAALQVVHGLVFDRSSPLYQRLVVQEQKVLELDSWEGWFRRDPHLFVVNAVLKPGQAFEPIRQAIQSALKRVAAGKVGADRVAEVKSHLRYSMLTRIQTPDDVANMVGQFIAVGGKVGTLEEYLEALSQVTAEEVQKVAEQYLVPERRFVVTLAPKAQASDSSKSGGGS